MSDSTTPMRPLIICDIDEVLMHFIRHFEIFLENRGYQLNAVSYRLDGNIIDKTSNIPLPGSQTKPLIDALFDEISTYQELVEGAFESIETLRKDCDIVFLTNLPEKLKEARQARLKRLGIDLPLLTNSGSKGEAISKLMEHRTAPGFFIDDSPMHHHAALGLERPPHCIHFVADARYAALASKYAVPGTRFLTRDWSLVRHYIEASI